MRILVISNSEWNDSTSFGNTFTNIFNGIDNIEIANIYCRKGNPETKICKKFLSITDKNMLKSVFNHTFDPAKKVECTYNQSFAFNNKDNAIVKFAKRKRWAIFYFLREILWVLGNYKKSNFFDFIEEFNPDIIFLPLYIYSYIDKMGLYLNNKLSCPLITYMGDNIYSLKCASISPLFWINRIYQRRIILKSLNKSAKVYVSTKTQQEELKQKFNINSSVLVKSEDFTITPKYKTSYNTIFNLTYTGTLGNGRIKGLIIIARALQELEKDGIYGVINVYSLTPIGKRLKKKLTKTGHAELFSPVNNSRLEKIYEKADVLVFSEPLNKLDSLQSMGSFSTKLVGYMHSARCIYAIGYKNLASIKHICNYAFVSKGKKYVKNELKNLLNFEMLNKYAHLSYECGKKYHDKKINAKKLENDLLKVK